MNPQASPLVIEHPRSADEICERLQRLLEQAGFGQPDNDPLRVALVRIAARDGEILTGCLNAAPDLHLRAFSEFLAASARPAAAAHVHLAFTAAPGTPPVVLPMNKRVAAAPMFEPPGTAPVVVPMNTRVAAVPMEGDTAPVVFETSEDLELVRAECLQAWLVDAGHLHLADVSTMLSARGRSAGDPLGAFVIFVLADRDEHRVHRDGAIGLGKG